MSSLKLIRVKSEEDVITSLCELIQDVANKSIESEDVFKIGLSG